MPTNILVRMCGGWGVQVGVAVLGIVGPRHVQFFVVVDVIVLPMSTRLCEGMNV